MTAGRLGCELGATPSVIALDSQEHVLASDLLAALSAAGEPGSNFKGDLFASCLEKCEPPATDAELRCMEQAALRLIEGQATNPRERTEVVVSKLGQIGYALGIIMRTTGPEETAAFDLLA